MSDMTTTAEPRPDPSVMDVFEEYIRTREFEFPPPVDTFDQQLPDGESRRSFHDLVESYAWTQDLLPRNVQPNVVLAGRFRLIERLGAGGMGQVWRAVDQKLGKQVAVKVMSLIGTASLDAEVAFERESHLLAQLKHPGIVTVLDSDRDDEHRFLVMDLVEGKSLEQVIDHVIQQEAERASMSEGKAPRRSASDILSAIDTKLEPGLEPLLTDEDWNDAVAKIMVHVLYTLEAAHSRLVVHRDLKPGNLMLRAGGQPALLDFGLGGMIGGAPGDLTSSLFGTFRFVAPEQLSRGRAGTDVRTDIYQLGIVLYEFLTLRKCFETSDHAELFGWISKGSFTMPRAIDPQIPRDLEDIVLRAMDVNPAQRYQDAAEYRQALERYLKRQPVHPDRYGPAARVLRSARYTVRRHRPVVIGTAAVIAVGVMTWLAGDLLKEPVQVRTYLSAKGERRLAINVSESNYLVVFFRMKRKTTGDQIHVPAGLLLESANGDFEKAEKIPLVSPGKEYRFQAVLPEEVEREGVDVKMTYLLAPDRDLFAKVSYVLDEVANQYENNGEFADDSFFRRKASEVTRGAGDLGVRIPVEKLFEEKRRWNFKSIIGETVTWPEKGN